jgi:hypothetical protein
VPSSINAKKVIAEAASEHGVLLEEGDPLFIALAAHVVVLQEVGDRLLREVEDVSHALRATVPAEIESALRTAVETAAESVRRGLDSDIESARLKARAIVDAVYRAQSRAAMWTWLAVGLFAALLLFGGGMLVGRFCWR